MTWRNFIRTALKTDALKEETIALIDGVQLVKQQLYGNPLTAFGRIRQFCDVLPVVVLFEGAEQVARRHPDISDDYLKIHHRVDREIEDALIEDLDKHGIPWVFTKDVLIGDILLRWVPDLLHNYKKKVIMVAGHRCYQFVTPESIAITPTWKDYSFYHMRQLISEYGFTGQAIEHMHVLAGDSRNSGIRGIGEQSAKKLLKAYGSLRGVYMHLGRLSSSQQRKLGHAKSKYREIYLDGPGTMYKIRGVPKIPDTFFSSTQ